MQSEVPSNVEGQVAEVAAESNLESNYIWPSAHLHMAPSLTCHHQHQ